MDIVVHEASTNTAVLECSGRLNMVSAPASGLTAEEVAAANAPTTPAAPAPTTPAYKRPY